MSETPTVLVVDDEESVAEGYGLWLSGDYEVRVTTGGEEALDALDADVDAVLLDRRMPGLSGDEVLDRIDERDDTDPRVAMVTAVDPDFDIVDMPFDAYLTKPVERETLLDTVDQLVALADHDDTVNERFRVAEKKASLEKRKLQSELEDSEKYQQLKTKLEELEAESEDAVDGMDHDTFTTAIRDL
ncbi:response regulator [Halosegnis rubeus]|uniref:Response regulator n=1 Tax=Halosegnis rubeus TaxID=2212850 RepID=A0A5N5U6J7_9EURY|nr:response regulator [Halosegnis rubeus]KAB7512472.1 response regulator [Halosegnis rubeus]KAB7514099.1 response regulator [Halosegnis rubeus]